MPALRPLPLPAPACAASCDADDPRTLDRLPDDLALDAAELFGVLADSTRLRIVATLMAGEVCVCEIAKRLDLRQSTVSHQLRLLRDLRLVAHRKQGRTVYYELSDHHVATLLRQTLDHLLEERGGEAGTADAPPGPSRRGDLPGRPPGNPKGDARRTAR